MRLQTRFRRAPRAGGALVLSVVAVLVVSILSAAFLQLATAISRRLGASADTAQALNLAEAGLAEAYTGLAIAKTGNVGSQAAPAVLGGGLLWVESTMSATGMVELECTAMYGTARATLGMVCQPVNIGVAGLGFFTLEDLRLNPDVRLDSYDSSQGPYADQVNTPLNNQGVVGSNGDISIASGNMIFGDVIHGPKNKADISAGSIVTGGVSPRADAETLPPIDVPDIPLGAPVKHSGGLPLIVPPGEAGYESLEVGKGSKVVLKGPLTIVVGELTLASDAELLYDTADGPVVMHVTESLDMKSGSLVSTSTQVTSDTIVMVSAPESKTVSFGAKSQFYGFIYAPYAEVHVSAQYEVYGGVVCKELQLAAQGRMHYDLSLGATLESILPILHAWRVVDVPAGIAARRMDPFQVLDLDPAALLSPAEAHEDQVLDVRFVNQNGSRDSFLGLESDFDWSLVQEVLYGTRDGLAFFLPDDYAQTAVIADDPFVDLVESTLTSKELRDELLAATPVSEEGLVAACLRDPPMAKSDLEQVLQAQPTLSDPILRAAIESDSLDSGTLTNLLVAQSPLSADVLAAATTRIPALSLADLTKLLGKQ